LLRFANFFLSFLFFLSSSFFLPPLFFVSCLFFLPPSLFFLPPLFFISCLFFLSSSFFLSSLFFLSCLFFVIIITRTMSIIPSIIPRSSIVTVISHKLYFSKFYNLLFRGSCVSPCSFFIQRGDKF
jgi:hypothetical protein